MEDGDISSFRKEPDNLTVDEQQLKQLLFLSFYLSQGSPFLQKSLLEWVTKAGYLPHINIDRNIPSYIESITPPRVHRQTKASAYEVELGRAWNYLYDITHSDILDKLEEDQIVGKIVKEALFQDLYYQFENRPGRTSNSEAEADSLQDSHSSLLRRHVLSGQLTKVSAFDDLFTRMKPTLEGFQSLPTDPNFEEEMVLYGDNLKDDIALLTAEETFINLRYRWELNHPGQTFSVKTPQPIKISP